MYHFNLKNPVIRLMTKHSITNNNFYVMTKYNAINNHFYAQSIWPEGRTQDSHAIQQTDILFSAL